MRPVIGITPDFNAGDRKDMGGHEPTYFVRGRYIRAVEELGGVPLILPLVAEPSARRRLLDRVDGLLITGSGPDLPPTLYGERQRYEFPLVSARRADFELELVLQASKRDL
ncbi:gamma-glutamyl-gamma-aminobutyrate hydrolase family protein, partial [Nitrospira sp. BLG_2]|uniref:gamma-glutamyl-gamma-aminobutyrate hydrolase family protein n=1 Tax=Nitrospira sp. BLG_2 TaxID=3397507 RepID=UPI003B9A4618